MRALAEALLDVQLLRNTFARLELVSYRQVIGHAYAVHTAISNLQLDRRVQALLGVHPLLKPCCTFAWSQLV